MTTSSSRSRLSPSASAGGPLSGDDPLWLGVASRLAARAGASPVVVRTAFMVLALAAGSGVALYLVMWVLLSRRVEPAPALVTLRHNLGIAVATASMTLAVGEVVGGLPLVLLFPAGLVGFSVALADPGEPGHESSAGSGAASGVARRAWRADGGRILAGVALMTAAFFSALAGTDNLSALWTTGVAALVLVGGLSLVLGPWIQRVLAEADGDRRSRIRAEERADMAAHLHDSVLQTLTLIQNRAAEPDISAALAHHQERELRRWLYPTGEDTSAEPVTFRAVIEAIAAEVEDQYLKIIECVVVGDSEMTPEFHAVAAAAREAMVNASKFAEIPMISVYAEVAPMSALVFVRDRGIGFEPSAVPADRHGIVDSIRGRVERVGGSVGIRSAPGSGTEVRVEWTG